jgi:hypothetical protein
MEVVIYKAYFQCQNGWVRGPGVSLVFLRLEAKTSSELQSCATFNPVRFWGRLALFLLESSWEMLYRTYRNLFWVAFSCTHYSVASTEFILLSIIFQVHLSAGLHDLFRLHG